MENDNKKGIFFGVIAVLTLIVAIIGASFAYFTATASGDNNAVTVKSTKIAISYTDGQIVDADDLIPVTTDIVKRAYNNASGEGICLDDNRKQVCGVFGFNIKNDGNTSQDITAVVLTNFNGFTNLKYIVYDITDSEDVTIVKEGTFAAAPDTVSLFGSDLNATKAVAASETNKYELLVYLNDTLTAQDDEQDKIYAGTITVSLAGSDGRVTGEISGG